MTIRTRIHLIGGSIIAAFVLLTGWTVKQYSESLYEEKRSQLKEFVDLAMADATHHLSEVRSGTSTLDEAQASFLEGMGHLRYGTDGYYWINDMTPAMVMHPIKPELNGTDLSGNEDPTGKRIFVEFVKTAREQPDGGIVEYMWPKAGSSAPVAKFSYVRAIPEWGWVVGTGVYVDDVRAQTWDVVKWLIAAAALITLVAGAGLFLFTRRLSAGMARLTRSADALAAGDDDIVIDYSDRDELGAVADSFRRVVAAQRDMTDAASSIASGEVNLAIQPRSEKDALGRAFVSLIATVRQLIEETNGLVTSARDGDLKKRADAQQFHGGYREMMTGLNQLLEAVATPIDESARVLERVAARDLKARMQGDYKGDYARIRDSLNLAATNLDEAMSEVSVASEQVSSAADQISAGSQQLAEGSSEQASALEEVSSSLQEMASMSRQNAANAREARGLAESARTSAARGVESMHRLSTAMSKIKESSDATAKIVKTIDEIAFQTNLLALNAAVEAARAGDAGKGFAVVAEEVRNLAMRSAQAAKNTADLIEDAVRNSEGGVEINAEVMAKLSEIDAGVNKVGEVMAEIAAASEQQTQGVDQISVAVEQMNGVTQQTAANSEESASAAEELSGQADRMRELVGSFQLSRQSSAARPAARTTPAPKPQPSMKAAPRKPAARKNGHANGNGVNRLAAAPAGIIPLDDDDLSALSEF